MTDPDPTAAEPTLEQVEAELARMDKWAQTQFLVLPESQEGQYIDALRRAKKRLEATHLAAPRGTVAEPIRMPAHTSRVLTDAQVAEELARLPRPEHEHVPLKHEPDPTAVFTTPPATGDDAERLIALAEEWRAKAVESWEEAGRIKRTIKAETDAEIRCNVRAEIWNQCSSQLSALAPAVARQLVKLRAAVYAAGFSVMETSGDWSIHDVSEKGKAADAVSLRVATENAHLWAEVKRLREALEFARTERGG